MASNMEQQAQAALDAWQQGDPSVKPPESVCWKAPQKQAEAKARGAAVLGGCSVTDVHERTEWPLGKPVGANGYQVKPAQQGWQCCVCHKGNAPFSAICGNPVCGLDFSNVR